MAAVTAATLLVQTTPNQPPGFVIEGNPRILVATTMGPQSLSYMKAKISPHGTKQPLCKQAVISTTTFPKILVQSMEGAAMPIAHQGAICSCGCILKAGAISKVMLGV